MGERIRHLRLERGVTAEQLVFEGKRGSKGYLSDIERGLALPSLHTLEDVARYLRVELFDLLVFPETSTRAALVDETESSGPASFDGWRAISRR